MLLQDQDGPVLGVAWFWQLDRENAPPSSSDAGATAGWRGRRGWGGAIGVEVVRVEVRAVEVVHQMPARLKSYCFSDAAARVPW